MSELQSTDNFREIPGYPGYFASNEGEIWSGRRRHGNHVRIENGRFVGGDIRKLSFRISKKCPYKMTTITDVNGKANPGLVHKYVLLAWHGLRPDGMEARHLDGNKMNNKPSNLAWGTMLENYEDNIRLGVLVCGDDCNWSKMTSELVEKMRYEMAAGGTSHAELSKKYGFSASLIGYAVSGKTWKRTEGPITPKRKASDYGCLSAGTVKLTSNQVTEIRRTFMLGGTTKTELAIKYGVDRSTVGDIINRKSWRHIPDPTIEGEPNADQPATSATTDKQEVVGTNP
jgi:hypothetical protein